MGKQAPPPTLSTRRPVMAQLVVLGALALLWGCGPDTAPTATPLTLPAAPTATTAAGNELSPTTVAAGLTPTVVATGPSPAGTIVTSTPGASLGLLKHHDVPPGGVQRQMDFGGGMGGGGPIAMLAAGDHDAAMEPAEMGDFYLIGLSGWAAKTPVLAGFTYPDGRIVRETRTTDGQGYAELDWVSLPGEPLGLYKLTVQQGSLQATGSFQVRRATSYHVSALPQRGPAGTTFRIALAGLPPQAPVPLFIYRQSADKSSTYLTLLPAITTDANGEALTSLPTTPGDPAGHYLVITSPDLAGAELEVTARPGGPPAGAAPGLLGRQDSPPPGVDARAMFELGNNFARTLDPGLPVARMPPVGVADPGAGIYLTGFVPGQEVIGLFTYPDGRRLRMTAAIDTYGTGSLSWACLPGEPLGRYTVTATQGNRVAQGSFLVEPASHVSVAVRPATGPPGTTFQIGVAGYPPGSPVRLYLYRTASATGKVDFVAAFPEAQADARGEVLLSLPTSADDPVGSYVVVRGEDAGSGVLIAHDGYFAVGNAAP